MFFTYSPCAYCGHVNHALVSAGNGEVVACNSCRNELPLAGAVNVVDSPLLVHLLRKCPLPVALLFQHPGQRCHEIERAFAAAATKLGPDAVFASIECSAHAHAADLFRVSLVPTVLLATGFVEQSRLTGVAGYERLVDWLEGELGLAAA